MRWTTPRVSCAAAAVAAVGIAVPTATTAIAWDVAGRLRVTAASQPRPAADTPRTHYWDEWNGLVAPEPARPSSEQTLAAVLVGDGPLAPEQPNFKIVNGDLSPRTWVARTGESVDIENLDPMSHQIVIDNLDGWTATPIASTRTRAFVASPTGDWPLRDEFYRHIRGHLHVIDNLVARATVTPNGTFRFTGVPAGRYELKVFRGDKVVLSKPNIVVQDRELTLAPMELTSTNGASQRGNRP